MSVSAPPFDPLDLAQRFLRQAPADWLQHTASATELAQVLQALWTRGRDAFPAVALTPASFVEFVARHATADARDLAGLSALHADGLYLACAYGSGDAQANEHIEREYMADVRRALERSGAASAQIADIQQELRHSLLEMRAPAATRRAYGGRGDLSAWLRLCAVRRCVAQQKREARERPLVDEGEGLLLRQDPSQDLRHLIAQYKEPLQASLTQALTLLSSRERNLLRSHFLQRLSIDQIAALYGVHRATAARWILRAQDRLSEETRRLFLSQTPVRSESYASLTEALRSQLSINLDKLLNAQLEPEPAAVSG